MASFRFCKDCCLCSAVASHLPAPVASFVSTAFPFPFAADGIGPVPSQLTASFEDVAGSVSTFVCKLKRSINDCGLVGVAFVAVVVAVDVVLVCEVVAGGNARRYAAGGCLSISYDSYVK